MFQLNKTLSAFFLFWLLSCSLLLAGPKDPIEGEQFQKYIELQNEGLRNALVDLLPEEDGYIVSGPLNPIGVSNDKYEVHFTALIVICPNLNALKESSDLISLKLALSERVSQLYLEGFHYNKLPGYRGTILPVSHRGSTGLLQVMTLQQLRYLIWALQHLDNDGFHQENSRLNKYALAVSNYLHEIDKGNLEAPEPKAVDFGLKEKYDLYAPAPDYVIQGYQNYKDYLNSHAEIVTSKLSELLAYVPTESGLERLKAEAPARAFPNKEFPLLQEEFRKFIRRGGKMDYMRTLTKEVFDTLKAGEYFFAVGLSGQIRLGRELLREEVKRIEQETGQKPARANHAFLFVGEPIMTAGAFFIENNGEVRISEVNTQSGHYFYSNITATIREDIAERSNDYFKTIGHFFKALDSLGIDYQNVLLRKL